MSSPVQGAQSFSRSIAVLQSIADAATPPSRAELLKLCDLTRPTLYRIIASLEAEGMIEVTAGNRYTLGSRLVALARTALAQNDVRRVAEPYLARLRDATGETVHLAIRSGDTLVYIDKIESREAVRMASTVGTRISFHSTGVGKAFLAAMPEAEANALIDRIDLPAITPHTTIDRAALKAIVRQAREDGFVRDDQENEVGIFCFGAPIQDGSNRPVAAVSVSVPMFRMGQESRYSAPLLEAVSAISRRLGHDGTT
jgi:DNA-binding IclR family transcriptional regulator